MAGLSSKSAWLGIARQTGGTKILGTATAPPTAPTFKLPFAGGSIGPVRETDRLAETDTSRDQSAAYVTTAGVEGSPEVYVRADSIGTVLAAAIGAPTTVPGPPIVHTFKPAAALDYYTLWRNVGGASGIYEQFTDCMVGAVTFSADAGAPLTAAMSVQGLTTVPIHTSGTKTTLQNQALASAPVFNFNNAAVAFAAAGATPNFASGSTRAVSAFELSVENNVTRQQTDDVTPYDVVPGTREISLGFDIIFENADEYFKFHTGSASGTSISPNIYTAAAQFTFTLDANNEIVFTLPSIAYEEYPVEPDPGGDPIVVSARAVAQKATGITDLLTVTLKNTTASYAT